MSKLFFFKENDTNDRDCVKYLEIRRGMPYVCGACFSGMWGKYPAYENVTTILTEDEYNTLCHDKTADNEKDISPIFDKLRSEENDKLFEQVQQEEIEWLMNEYNLDEQEVLDIFEDYGESYRDRGIICYVYEDAYDLGYETVCSYGIGDNYESIMERYFDFKEFGEDLMYDYGYIELNDGRIVSLNC